MSMSIKKTALALCVGLAMGSTAASAAVVWFPPVTGFQDDDLEWHISGGQVLPNGGTLNVGDELRAVVEIPNTFGVLGGGSAAVAPDELTGLASITVVSKSFDAGSGLWSFVFGPTVGFMGNADNNGATPGAGTGVTIRLWLDDTANLDIVSPNCVSLANCSALASDGAFYIDFGFAGDVNERWTANSVPTDNTGLIQAGDATEQLGLYAYGQSILANNTGQLLGLQACGLTNCFPGGDNLIAMSGSGTLLGGQGLTNGAVGRSDFDFQLRQIPEPSTLAMLGGMLLGLAGFARARRKG
jgi:PEP-CTERM motif